MDNQIFRKKSIERLSSPEALNEYVRVSNPGVWMLLFAIIALLVGTCVWGVAGTLETKLTVAAVTDGETTCCYVGESQIGSVEVGMTVNINGDKYAVTAISSEPFMVTEDIDEYTRHVGKLQLGAWVYEVTTDAPTLAGAREAAIITESISPIKFITN